MKKILALILVVAALLAMTACGGESNVANPDNNTDVTTTTGGSGVQDVVIEHTGKKIEGKITGASVYSEGLAFVSVDNNKDKTYCINEEGYIVFELDFRTVDAMGKIYSRFVNGLALVGDAICDTKGNLTMPEDVGATTFCDIALEGGYIVAEKITSDYSSSKKELGVMNTKFEWVVNPSEDLYNITGGVSMIATSNNCFYYNDYFYFEGTKVYLNLKTGETTEQIDNFPSSQWMGSYKGFYDLNNNEMLNLESYETLNMAIGSSFIGGKAPVRFINTETNKYYFTVINEAGEFLFEPIETIKFEKFVYDGETILVLSNAVSAKTIVSYNLQGEKLGQIDTDTVATNHNFTCRLNDGIVVLNGGSNFKYVNYYYNTDFTSLF